MSYKCDKCGKEFPYPSYLRFHYPDEEDKSTHYKLCIDCCEDSCHAQPLSAL